MKSLNVAFYEWYWHEPSPKCKFRHKSVGFYTKLFLNDFRLTLSPPIQGRLTERRKQMIPYMKRVAQVVVLTAVLVFSGLLVGNTDFITQDAEAAAHQPYDYHVTLYKYYTWGDEHTPHRTNYYRHTDYVP